MTPTKIASPPRPGTPQWRHTISSSKVPAILGLSPFQSPFACWQEMFGNLTPQQAEGDHLDWGHDAEHSLTQWWCRKNNPKWRLNSPRRGVTEVSFTDPDLPFPNLATLDRIAYRGPNKRHIIECKTTRSLETWGKPDEPDSVPAHYTAQVMWQMGISGIHEASVVVLAYGTPEIHTIQWDPALFEAIKTRCEMWWESGRAQTPPDLDDTTATYNAVRGLHPLIDQDEQITVSEGEAIALLDAKMREDQIKTELRGLKTRLLHQMGNARKATVGDTTIATRSPGRGDTVTLRINTKATL